MAEGKKIPLVDKPGIGNKVEAHGGIPEYAKSIAEHIKGKHPNWDDGRCIASARNTLKRWAAGGTVHEHGGGTVSKKTQAKAAAALAEWVAKENASIETQPDLTLAASALAEDFDEDAYRLALAAAREERGIEQEDLDLALADGDVEIDEGQFILAIQQERAARGIPLAGLTEKPLDLSTDGDSLNMAIFNWDPDLHPRDLHGKFKKSLSQLKVGGTLETPDGLVVKKGRNGFSVNKRTDSGKLRDLRAGDRYDEDQAAQVAMVSSGMSTHSDDALGGREYVSPDKAIGRDGPGDVPKPSAASEKLHKAGERQQQSARKNPPKNDSKATTKKLDEIADADLKNVPAFQKGMSDAELQRQRSIANRQAGSMDKDTQRAGVAKLNELDDLEKDRKSKTKAERGTSKDGDPGTVPAKPRADELRELRSRKASIDRGRRRNTPEGRKALSKLNKRIHELEQDQNKEAKGGKPTSKKAARRQYAKDLTSEEMEPEIDKMSDEEVEELIRSQEAELPDDDIDKGEGADEETAPEIPADAFDARGYTSREDDLTPDDLDLISSFLLDDAEHDSWFDAGVDGMDGVESKLGIKNPGEENDDPDAGKALTPKEWDAILVSAKQDYRNAEDPDIASMAEEILDKYGGRGTHGKPSETSVPRSNASGVTPRTDDKWDTKAIGKLDEGKPEANTTEGHVAAVLSAVDSQIVEDDEEWDDQVRELYDAIRHGAELDEADQAFLADMLQEDIQTATENMREDPDDDETDHIKKLETVYNLLTRGK